jgi:hypothetical protein
VSGLVNAQSAPTEAQASAIAVQFDHSVGVDADTTPTEEVSALPDGTMQFTENSVPVRVPTTSGWEPVDTNLTTSSDGLLAPAATDEPVEFSAGGSSLIAKVATSTGEWVDETSPFGVLPTPSVDGSVATYANVLPGVDLVLTANADGMSEVLAIDSATAAANPALAAVNFNVTGTDLATSAGGPSTATASDGSTVISTTPTWWDSSDGSGADGPQGESFADPVPQTDSSSTISLGVQSAIAQHPVEYPVYVDPDWTGGLEAFSDVDKGHPTTSYWEGQNTQNGDLGTGFVAAAYSPDGVNHTARSLWRMNTSSVEGKHIIKATFDVTEDHSFNCTASTVDLYTSNSFSSGTTWNAQPSLIQLQSSATVAYGESACPEHSVGFTATAGVTTAAAAHAAYVSFELHALSETVDSSWKRFLQSASLVIDYNTVPVISTTTPPQFASPVRSCVSDPGSPVLVNGTQPLSLQVTTVDPDAGASVSVAYSVFADGNPTAIQTGAAPAAAVGNRTWSILANSLTPGELYYWNATVNDGTDSSPTASPSCYFEVKNTRPGLPTVVGSGQTSVGAPMTVQFSSDPADGVVSFAYWWSDGAAATTGPSAPSTYFSTTSAVPADGAAAGPVRYADSVGTSGESAALTVAPIDTESTLYVASFDGAGNESLDGSSSSSSLDVTVSASPTVDYTNGHQWELDGLPALSNPVVDSNTTVGTGLTNEADLTMGSTVNTTGTSQFYSGGVYDSPVFSFTASPAQIVSTSHRILDTTQSFTATAWINLPSSAGTAKETILAQSGATNAGFEMQIDGTGKLQFCVVPQITGHTEDCATAPTALPLATWVLATGIWDAANQQVRLLVGNSIIATSIQPHVVPSGDTSSTGNLLIGSDFVSGASARQWVGQIDDPAVFPGVIDSAQLLRLSLFDTVNP